MSHYIQPLEQRMFFSVTSAMLSADLSTVNSDAKTVRADLNAVRATASHDVKTVADDVKGLSNKTQNNKLLATLRSDDAKSLARIEVAQESYLASDQALAAVVTVEAKILVAHPTNSALRARVAANASKLNSTVASKLATLQSAVNTAVSTYDTDVQAIADANPTSTQVAADVATAKADVSTSIPTTSPSQYLAAANQFKVDTGVLATDATSV